MNASDPTPLRLGPLERGLKVLEILCQESRPMSFTKLSAALGQVHQSTLSKLLKVLVQLGYLHKSSEGYSLGAAITTFKNANNHDLSQELIDCFSEALQDISRRFGVTTILLSRVGQNMRSIDKHVHEMAPALQPLNSSNNIDGPSPWCGLLRKACGVREKGSITIDDQGVAMDDGHHFKGLLRLGIGIYNDNGHLDGCLAMGAIRETICQQQKNDIIKSLTQLTSLWIKR